MRPVLLLDALASEKHYLDHLLPLWAAIPEEIRGTFYVTRPLLREGLTLGRPRDGQNPVLVASFKDSLQVARTLRDVIYLEHGAGQTYQGDPSAERNGGYSGGDGHGSTILFLSPNEAVAERWRERYPGVPAVAIGSPRLESLSRLSTTESRRFSRKKSSEKTVAISFHWHCGICPEADWTFPYYRQVLPALRDRFHLIGHGHPRAWVTLRHEYRKLGIEAVESFDEVLDRASVYAVDNSSTMYEAAALGIPIVALNAPHYRRDVHHGLRFWDQVPGLQCDQPEALVATIECALEDPPEVSRIREETARSVYPHLGTAASRGAAAILEVMGSR